MGLIFFIWNIQKQVEVNTTKLVESNKAQNSRLDNIKSTILKSVVDREKLQDEKGRSGKILLLEKN